MEITKTSGVCFECKKIFDEGFLISFNRKFFLKLKLCSCCATKLYLGLANSFVPKSPKNIINKQKINIKN